MIALSELDIVSAARLEDARTLQSAQRPDGAMYLCGYAVEIALKAQVCRTLGWSEFPMTANEFKGLSSFRTHDLEILLRLSGKESHVKQKYFVDWNAVVIWKPEARYAPIGRVTPADAQSMIAAAEAVIGAL